MAHSRIAQSIDVRLTLYSTEAKEVQIRLYQTSSGTLTSASGTQPSVAQVAKSSPGLFAAPAQGAGLWDRLEPLAVTVRPGSCWGGKGAAVCETAPACPQASLYKQLNEDDLLHGLWRRRCRTEDTRAALTLVSAGLLPAAQDVLLDVMRKPWEQDSAPPPPRPGGTADLPSPSTCYRLLQKYEWKSWHCAGC